MEAIMILSWEEVVREYESMNRTSRATKYLKIWGRNNKGILMAEMLGATFIKEPKLFDLHRLLT